jgi:hypothetical protein
MRAISRLSRSGKLIVAVAVAGSAFAIASAVQASIPDGSGVVHACYNTSLAHGSPTGALRAIDTSTPSGNCAPWEGSVDLATPQFVTSTINPTSFMFKASGPLNPGQWVTTFFCPTGYIATEPSVAGTDQSFTSNDQLSIHSFYNQGELVSGVPSTNAVIFYTVSTATTNVTLHTTCVNGRVFGLAGPAAPIAQAEQQARFVTVNRPG